MNKYLSHKDSVENIMMIFGLHFLFLLSVFFNTQFTTNIFSTFIYYYIFDTS